MAELDLLARAEAFATTAHAGQKRKGTDLPYIVHPAEVAGILARLYPSLRSLIAAGWLHDTVEDTSVTIEDITKAFGYSVANLVAGATAVRGANWRATRVGQLAKLEGAPRDRCRLKGADATSNARAIGRDRAALGPAVWKRFGAGPDDIRWYYAGILTRVRAVLADEPLVTELAAAVAGLGQPGEP
jgi:(p)ppGpp synthase/HD superfamily hydrolase